DPRQEQPPRHSGWVASPAHDCARAAVCIVARVVARGSARSTRTGLMKIALVASSYLPRPDGLERHVGKLASALAQSGVQVEVLTQDAGRRLPRVLSFDGVVLRRFLLPVGAGHGAVAPGLWETLRRSAGAF